MNVKDILKKIVLPIAGLFCWNMFCYRGAMLIQAAGNFTMHSVDLPVDDWIPLFVPSVHVYAEVCYVFWLVSLALVFLRGGKEAKRFALSIVIAEAVCALIFLVYPTTVVRPEIIGDGLSAKMLRLIYEVDNPVNLFPSVHCLGSWFGWIAVRGDKKIPKWYRVTAFVLMVLICVSTLTTKQHVFLDLVGGIALAEITYRAVGMFMKKE